MFPTLFLVSFILSFHSLANSQGIATNQDEILSEESDLMAWLGEKCKGQWTIRPVTNYNNPLEVQTGFRGIKFRDINDATQMYVVKFCCKIFDKNQSIFRYAVVGTVILSWQHPCLKWGSTFESKKWSHIESLWVPALTIWVPPVIHRNALVDVTFLEVQRKYTNVRIRSNGTVIWQISAKYDSFCELELKKFPFDSQRCELKLQSELPSQKIKFLLTNQGEMVPKTFTSNIDVWKVHSVQSEQTTLVDSFSMPFDSVSFQITMKRQPSLFLLNLVLPMMVMLVLLLSTFFMFPQESSRTGFCLTSMLTLAVISGTIFREVPASSEIIYIVRYSTTLTMLAFCTTIYSLIVIPIAKSDRYQQYVKLPKIGKISITKMTAIDFIFYSALAIAIFLTNVILFSLMMS